MSLSKSLLSLGRRVAVQSGRSLMTKSAAVSSHQRLLAMRGCGGQPLVANFSTKTKGDAELSTFLSEEIEAEKKARKQAALPKVDGFDIELKESDVTLSRRFNDEAITVKLNVNHSVDAEETGQDEQEPGEMLAKPNFDVIIEKGGQKLLLSCTFAHEDPAQQQDDFDDLFQIVEFSMYSDAESKDSDYSVSGDIMDSQLYDLLMNLLEERGVTNEFSEQLVDFCTSYEHGLYIGLLEKLKGFVSK